MKIKRPSPFQKVPNDAKIVFKGVIFDVVQWEQEMYDGSYKTFEILKRPDTAVLIPVTKDKKIIIIKEAQPGKDPVFAFPGGRLEPKEDPIFAAKRELLEETGYGSETLSLFKAVTPLTKIDWVIYYFIAKDCVDTGEQDLDFGENITIKLIDFETMIDMLINEEIPHEPNLTKIALRAKLFPEDMKSFRSAVLD
ncbi:MAG: hypothetical protein Kow0081_4360 [Candidatus Dojkabacteria bacterium]